MSWTNVSFDKNIPSVELQLATQDMIYDNYDQPSQTQYCNSLCSFGPPDCKSCTPTFTNICPVGSAEIMRMYEPAYPTQVGDKFLCNSSTATSYTGEPVIQEEQVKCKQTLIQSCGNFNGTSTCTLGKNGVGTCPSPKQNFNWGVTSTTNPLQGWTMCVYSYDFTNYNTTNIPNGPGPFSRWLYDVCTGTSSSIPQGLDKSVVPRVRDSNVIYSMILDFYNQLYGRGYYKNNTAGNNFLTYDYTGEATFVTFITNFLQTCESYFYGLYPAGTFPTELNSVLNSILGPPEPSQSDDTYTLTFQLSYTQYQDFLSNPDQAGFITEYMCNILRDTQAWFSNENTQRWTPADPVLVSPTVNYISAIQLEPDYILTTGISPSDWENNPGKYPGYIFGTVSITATVQTWSPMLVAYFGLLYKQVSYSPQICKQISTEGGSGFTSTIPTVCFTQDCTSDQPCVADMKNFCTMTYNPPSPFNYVNVSKYLVNSNSDSCLCYNSLLSPSGDGNKGAMCYDISCTPEIRSYFGLSDNICQGYCQQVNDWVTGTGADQSRNATKLDNNRFTTLCGKIVQEYTDKEYNIPVAGTGTILTILSSILAFSICKNKNFSITKTVLITGGIFILGGLLSAFFSRDLAGVGNCYGKDFLCKSRITKVNLPLDFCAYTRPCECSFNQDCASGCICQSSACLPVEGQRKTSIQTYKKMNIPMLIVSIVIFVLFTASLLYLYQDYHWNIPKPVFITCVVILGLLPIVYYVYDGLKKKSKVVFDGPCTGCVGSCTGKECGDDGCGNDICGSCASGFCVNNQCVECKEPGQSCLRNEDCCYNECVEGVCKVDPCVVLPIPQQDAVRTNNYGGICSSCKNCILTDVVVDNSGKLTLPVSATLVCEQCQRTDGSYGAETSVDWKFGQYVANTDGQLQITTQLGSCVPNAPVTCDCATDQDCKQTGASQKCNVYGNCSPCAVVGQTCSQSEDCCTNVCENGVCVTPPTCKDQLQTCTSSSECCYPQCEKGICVSDPCLPLENVDQEQVRKQTFGGMCQTCESCDLWNPQYGLNTTLPLSATVHCVSCKNSQGQQGPETQIQWKFGQTVTDNNGVLSQGGDFCDISNPGSCLCNTDNDCVALGASKKCLQGKCG